MSYRFDSLPEDAPLLISTEQFTVSEDEVAKNEDESEAEQRRGDGIAAAQSVTIDEISCSSSKETADSVASITVTDTGTHEVSNQSKSPQTIIEEDSKSEPAWIVGGKVRTLKDYVDGKAKKSPRGIDLELIKASPREEDLTKIKFARFVFDGVKTSVLSRTVRNADGTVMEESTNGGPGKNTSENSTVSDASHAPSSNKGNNSFLEETLQTIENDDERLKMMSVHQINIEEDIDRLKKLSQKCIEQSGLHVIGQEYTKALKTVCKTLDIALRAGIGDQGLQNKSNLANNRFDSVQRLSAILHEYHDAEVQLSNNCTQELIKSEHAIWVSEIEEARPGEDKIRGILLQKQLALEAEIKQKVDTQLLVEEAEIRSRLQSELQNCIQLAIRRQNSEQRLQESAIIRDYFREQDNNTCSKANLSRSAPTQNGARRSLLYQEADPAGPARIHRSPRDFENDRLLTPGSTASNNVRFLF